MSLGFRPGLARAGKIHSFFGWTWLMIELIVGSKSGSFSDVESPSKRFELEDVGEVSPKLLSSLLLSDRSLEWLSARRKGGLDVATRSFIVCFSALLGSVAGCFGAGFVFGGCHAAEDDGLMDTGFLVSLAAKSGFNGLG